MNLNKIYEIMTAIEKESSKTGKEKILKDNQGNNDFVEALKFLLNPFIVTGISTKKINKKFKDGLVVKGVLLGFKGLLEHLRKNNSGRDEDIRLIQQYIEQLETPELQTFVKKFVTKDLKLGISEKTVNKVYGKGAIPTFGVMLAESFEKKQDKVKGKFYITLKLDGNRCAVIKEDGVVKFFTRKGQPIEGLVELEEEFKHFPDNRLFDGELILANTEGLSSADLFRATQKVVRKDGEKKNLEFHMFDTIPLDEFKTGKSKKKYEQRRNEMELMFGKLSDSTNGNMVESLDLKFIKLVDVLYEGEDKSVIPAYAVVVEKEGFEGLMVNTADGLYQTKRVVDLLKVKSMKTADLLVMSIEKAIDGQFEGLMSRVNVEYKGGLCGVGSGFTLEQRKFFIENPDEIVGKIIEVQFFEESKDEKTGQLSLRFPVFKGIRDDKGVDDINYGE
ncbi:MAG: ATP-dependent DNA ligase [Psychrobacillus sp.]